VECAGPIPEKPDMRTKDTTHRSFSLVLFSLLAVACSTSESPVSASNHDVASNLAWGIGVLSRVELANRGESFNFPDSAVLVYESAQGDRVGRIIRDTSLGYFYSLVYIDDSTLKRHRLSGADAVEVVAEGICLKVYRIKNGRFEVLLNQVPGGLWLAEEELKQRAFEALQWPEFLARTGRFYFPRETGTIDVRSNPSLSSRVVTRIVKDSPRNRPVIQSLRHWTGRWLNVRVSDIPIYYLYETDTTGINWTEGWIEVVARDGSPTIWYFTRD